MIKLFEGTGIIATIISFVISIQQWFFQGFWKLDFFDIILKIGSIIIMIYTIIYLKRKAKLKRMEIDTLKDYGIDEVKKSLTIYED